MVGTQQIFVKIYKNLFMLELSYHSIYIELFFILHIHITHILIYSDITPEKINRMEKQMLLFICLSLRQRGQFFLSFLVL